MIAARAPRSSSADDRRRAGGVWRGLISPPLGVLHPRRRSAAVPFPPGSVARKLPGLQRVLEPPSLAAVAYGEIASSLFFALGVIALEALGFTPWVLLAVGVLFLLVALSYAEGTTAIPETGGARPSSAARSTTRSASSPAGWSSSTT